MAQRMKMAYGMYVLAKRPKKKSNINNPLAISKKKILFF